MRKLGVIVLVAVGLFAILQGVAFIGIILQTATLDGDTGVAAGPAVAAYVAPAVAALLIGTLLITYRVRLAERWFEDGEIDTTVDAVSLVRVLLIAIGLWMVTYSTTAVLASLLSGMISATQGFDGGGGLSVSYVVSRSVPQALQVVIGVVLIVRSEPLSRRLWGIRPAPPAPAGPPLPVCPSCGGPYDPADYRDVESAACSNCREPLPRA